VAALTTLCRDETIVRWTNVPTGYTESMAKARIAEADTERQAGRALILAVADAATDEALGACDLRIHDAGHAEIAYMLGAHARGRGVMTRAVLLISRWAIEQLNIQKIEILAHPDNLASIAVAERAGFQTEDVRRLYHGKKGRAEDRVVFTITAGES
jgi:RimJ/RimL family protein N-acetyltransferase